MQWCIKLDNPPTMRGLRAIRSCAEFSELKALPAAGRIAVRSRKYEQIRRPPPFPRRHYALYHPAPRAI